jgi:FAD/FMN-containing dehydrogenase
MDERRRNAIHGTAERRSSSSTLATASTSPRQRPELFAAALVAVKATLDPAGILNPGVLLDAR